MEGISSGWSVDIEAPAQPKPLVVEDTEEDTGTAEKAAASRIESQNFDYETSTAGDDVLTQYEERIRDPRRDRMPHPSLTTGDRLEVECEDTQTFLASQLVRIEQLKKEEEASSRDQEKSAFRPATTGDIYASNHESSNSRSHYPGEENRVNEHIGPVQFNVGGIQVDADDMLQRIKSRERSVARSDKGTPRESHTPTSSTPQKQDPESENRALKNFFAGLIKEKRTGSPRGERNT